MALETGTYINSLVATNPAATDGLQQADDHLRLIKSTIKATFPNLDGAMNATEDELNILDGATVTTSELNALDGITSTSSELNLLDGSSAGTVVNSKAVVYGSSGEVVGNTITLDNGSNDWTVTVTSNKLRFAYNGTDKMELDTSGNLKVTGDITAYGSI